MSPLSNHQWKKVAMAMAFSFVSTFLTAFMAGGGIQDTWDATFILVASSSVSPTNTVLYAITQLFKEDN